MKTITIALLACVCSLTAVSFKPATETTPALSTQSKKMMPGAYAYFVHNGIDYYLGSYYYGGPGYDDQVWYVTWTVGGVNYSTGAGDYGYMYANSFNMLSANVQFTGHTGTVTYNGLVMF